MHETIARGRDGGGAGGIGADGVSGGEGLWGAARGGELHAPLDDVQVTGLRRDVEGKGRAEIDELAVGGDDRESAPSLRDREGGPQAASQDPCGNKKRSALSNRRH